MRIFLTGATGFIGSALIPELMGAGHQVLGLTRSHLGAQRLAAVGADVHLGDIEDLAGLHRAANACDGVIHTAFDHDFANFAANCQKDARVIEALGAALHGSDRPLVITSSTAMGAMSPGISADEDSFYPDHPNPRAASERAGLVLQDWGVNVSVMRLSQIHNTVKQGLVTDVIALARRKGISAFIEDGRNAWSATHVVDAARLFRLALEKRQPGARYHATAESAIPFRVIAEAIARRFNLPAAPISKDAAAEHFGWLSTFVGKDMSASSTKTQHRLGWHTTGPGLIEDILAMNAAAS